LILHYYRYAQGDYVKNSKPTDELACIRSALKALRQLYGDLLAQKFRPKMFKLVREYRFVSAEIRNIQAAFRLTPEDIAPIQFSILSSSSHPVSSWIEGNNSPQYRIARRIWTPFTERLREGRSPQCAYRSWKLGEQRMADRYCCVREVPPRACCRGTSAG
jgi:hypothetical protein